MRRFLICCHNSEALGPAIILSIKCPISAMKRPHLSQSSHRPCHQHAAQALPHSHAQTLTLHQPSHLFTPSFPHFTPALIRRPTPYIYSFTIPLRAHSPSHSTRIRHPTQHSFFTPLRTQRHTGHQPSLRSQASFSPACMRWPTATCSPQLSSRACWST